MNLSRASKKTPHSDSRMTLNALDIQTINKIDNYYKTLPDKKNQLNGLIRKKNGMRKTYTNEYMNLCKEITNIEKEIENIEGQTHKNDYLLRAAPYFMDYTLSNDDNNEKKTEVFNGFTITSSSNRGRICEEYIKDCMGEGYSLNTKNIEESINKELTCDSCGEEKLISLRESYASCPKCGIVSKYQDTRNNRGEFAEEVEVLSPFAYKRINHFKEWLNTLTGEECSAINDEILDLLRQEMKKNRITNREQVTETLIKNYLKKLEMPKLYEHAPALRYKLCGIQPIKIPRPLKEKLVDMFQKIQDPFDKAAPSNRKNFLSYAYCIHKMLQLLQQDHLLVYLPLLKSREKLYLQDQIWKKITNEVGWAFIPSL